MMPRSSPWPSNALLASVEDVYDMRRYLLNEVSGCQIKTLAACVCCVAPHGGCCC